MRVLLENVTVAFDGHPAIHHLTGELQPGALLAVVGPNGAGKSTLLRALAGRQRLASGRIGIEPRRRGTVAYLPQQAQIDRSFPIGVRDLVSSGLWGRIGAFGGLGRRERVEVERALGAVGLEGFEARGIGTLSGGQLQRALFARLILQDAPLILLDEPFAAIDQRTVRDLMELIGRWHGEGRTVVAVLHDLEQVRSHFPETLLLAREPIAWGATREVLASENLLRARAMTEAFDDAAGLCALGATA
ncbi:MAG: metal ABC transporter ATP-binding protein [Hyphomicrobiaceae bacterium]